MCIYVRGEDPEGAGGGEEYDHNTLPETKFWIKFYKKRSLLRVTTNMEIGLAR